MIPGTEDLYLCPFTAEWLITFQDQCYVSCGPHAHDYLQDEPEAQAESLYPIGENGGKEGRNDG